MTETCSVCVGRFFPRYGISFYVALLYRNRGHKPRVLFGGWVTHTRRHTIWHNLQLTAAVPVAVSRERSPRRHTMVGAARSPHRGLIAQTTFPMVLFLAALLSWNGLHRFIPSILDSSDNKPTPTCPWRSNKNRKYFSSTCWRAPRHLSICGQRRREGGQDGGTLMSVFSFGATEDWRVLAPNGVFALAREAGARSCCRCISHEIKNNSTGVDVPLRVCACL